MGTFPDDWFCSLCRYSDVEAICRRASIPSVVECLLFGSFEVCLDGLGWVDGILMNHDGQSWWTNTHWPRSSTPSISTLAYSPPAARKWCDRRQLWHSSRSFSVGQTTDSATDRYKTISAMHNKLIRWLKREWRRTRRRNEMDGRNGFVCVCLSEMNIVVCRSISLANRKKEEQTLYYVFNAASMIIRSVHAYSWLLAKFQHTKHSGINHQHTHTHSNASNLLCNYRQRSNPTFNSRRKHETLATKLTNWKKIENGWYQTKIRYVLLCIISIETETDYCRTKCSACEYDDSTQEYCSSRCGTYGDDEQEQNKNKHYTTTIFVCRMMQSCYVYIHVYYIICIIYDGNFSMLMCMSVQYGTGWLRTKWSWIIRWHCPL